jgi:hypothetical protein
MKQQLRRIFGQGQRAASQQQTGSEHHLGHASPLF